MKLSIGMMVKNESKYLRQCLESLKPIRESIECELIIVDTGSTDNTVEIAKEFTNKVYFHQWNNDFSEIRNITIRYSTGEWFFYIDGDEVISNPNGIIQFFKSSKYKNINTACVSIKNFISNDNDDDFSVFLAPRLFKKNTNFHFEGTIHNQPIWKKPLITLNSDFLHYGYVNNDKELMERKFIRTSEILKNELKNNPENIYYIYQLSVSYAMHKDFTEALETIEKAYNMIIQKKLSLNKYMYVSSHLAKMYLINTKYNEVEKICLEAIKENNLYIDLYFYLSKAQYYMYKNKEAIVNYNIYLEKLKNIESSKSDDNISIIHYTLTSYEDAYLKMGTLYSRIGDYEAALKISKRIISNKGLNSGFNLIVSLFLRLSKYDELRDYFNKIIINNSAIKENFLITLELHLLQSNRETKENIFKVLSEGNYEYSLLNKIRLESENDYEKLIESISNLNFSELPDYYGDVLYYLLCKRISLVKYLNNVGDIKIRNYLKYLFKCHKNLGLKLYEYLKCYDKTETSFEEARIYKILASYIFNDKDISNIKYKEILDKYLEYGEQYLKQIYNQDIIESEFLYCIKDEEDLFLIYMHLANKSKNDEVKYIRYLRKALNSCNYMKRGIEILQEEINQKLIEKDNEMDLYKKTVKANIIKLIEEDELDKANVLINEYEDLIKNDSEIYSIKSVILLAENKLTEAENCLNNGLLIDSSNFDLNYNLAYVYEQTEKFSKAIEYYTKAENYCNDENLKKDIKSFINNIAEKNNNNVNIERGQEVHECNIKKVLFVQSIPDIRTNKIAQILHDKKIETDIMYLSMHPHDVYKGLKLPYKNILKLENINKTIKFINESDYDIIFSCNEPDYISALFTLTNKPIIHDCHDMMSLRGNVSNEQLILEYLANTKCDGNIYVTELVKKVAESKFDLCNKPIMLLDNYVLKEQLPKTYLRKLSDKDGEIHCVYEGGLTNIKGHHRNIEEIFLNLAQNNIHVHFYTAFETIHYRNLEKKSKYLHYEGTKHPNELILDMTKYDVGLAVLNVNDKNKTFLDTTFPNKAWEYMAARLPILFSDVVSFRQFINKYEVGEIITLGSNIKEQVKRVKELKISKDFLVNNNLLMDSFTSELVELLSKVKDTYYKS